MQTKHRIPCFLTFYYIVIMSSAGECAASATSAQAGPSPRTPVGTGVPAPAATGSASAPSTRARATPARSPWPAAAQRGRSCPVPGRVRHEDDAQGHHVPGVRGLIGEGGPGEPPVVLHARHRASRCRDGGDGHGRKPEAHKADLEGAMPRAVTAGQHRRQHVQYYGDEIE